MAVPRDLSINFTHSNGGIQAPAELAVICPHCRIASTFKVRSQVIDFVAPRHYAHLVVQCNFARCKKLVYMAMSITQGASAPIPSDSFYMYPSRSIDPPHAGVPASVSKDWIEAQKVMQASAPMATAVMLRRVLYSVLVDKGCKLQPVKTGLEQLITQERLPRMFDDWLQAIKDDGHDAAHPDRALNVSSENVEETIQYTSELLRYLYVEPYEFTQRKARNASPTKP